VRSSRRKQMAGSGPAMTPSEARGRIKWADAAPPRGWGGTRRRTRSGRRRSGVTRRCPSASSGSTPMNRQGDAAVGQGHPGRTGAMRRWADTVSNRGDDLCPRPTVATPWGRIKTGLRQNCDFAPAAGWASPRISVDSERDADLLCKPTPCYLKRVIYDLPTPADRHFRRRFVSNIPLLGPGSGFHRAPMPGKGRRDSIGDETCLPHSTA
jgi:hypothetical protein